MNFEDLDDPRARELKRVAVEVADAALECRITLNSKWLSKRYWAASQHFEAALDSYQALHSELEKEETRLTGGWRNEGE